MSARVEEDIGKDDKKKEEEKKGEEGIDKQIEKRIKASRKLIFEMKKLFANMAKSDKKYADPSGVI